MRIKGWRLAGVLALLTMAVFNVAAFAQEAGEEAANQEADKVSADTGALGEDENKDKVTMWGLVRKGGPLMVPLGLASVLALALALERFIALNKERVLPAGFIAGLTDAWNEDSSGAQAAEYCDESDCAAGQIFKAGVTRAELGPEAVEKAIEDVGSREADKLKRSLRPLSIIAAISPLLGLLGTVYGMIDAFGEVSSGHGTTQTALLATGIYEALVTTAAGLTIAIPVLLLYQFLQGRVDKLIDEIDEAGSDFVFACTQGKGK